EGRAGALLGQQPAAAQLRGHMAHEVLLPAGTDDAGEVEAVDVGRLAPAFELVDHGRRRTDDDRTTTADADEVRHLADGPDPIGVECGERAQRGLVRLRAQMLDGGVDVRSGKVDPGPAAEEGERRLRI